MKLFIFLGACVLAQVALLIVWALGSMPWHWSLLIPGVPPAAWLAYVGWFIWRGGGIRR